MESIQYTCPIKSMQYHMTGIDGSLSVTGVHLPTVLSDSDDTVFPTDSADSDHERETHPNKVFWFFFMAAVRILHGIYKSINVTMKCDTVQCSVIAWLLSNFAMSTNINAILFYKATYKAIPPHN